MSGDESIDNAAAVPPRTPVGVVLAALKICNEVDAPKAGLAAVTLAGVLWHLHSLRLIGVIFFVFGVLLIVAAYADPVKDRFDDTNNKTVFWLGVLVMLFASLAAYTALFVTGAAAKAAKSSGATSTLVIAKQPVYNFSFVYAPSSERVSTVTTAPLAPPPPVKKKTSVSVHIHSAKSTAIHAVDAARPTCPDSAQGRYAPDVGALSPTSKGAVR
jgi:hypothetical protein